MVKGNFKNVLNEMYYSSIVQKDRLIIDEVQWNLGGSLANEPCSSKTASGWYTSERGTVVYGSNPKTWTGKIALIYPSDYAFPTNGTGTVAGRNTCINTSTWKWSNNWGSCAKNSWIYLDRMFCITPTFSQGNVRKITGTVNGDVYYAANPIKPVLYLNPNVKIVSGKGISTDPYILSL